MDLESLNVTELLTLEAAAVKQELWHDTAFRDM